MVDDTPPICFLTNVAVDYPNVNDSGFMTGYWGGHAILGHFKKLIRKLNVIVRLLAKSRGDSRESFFIFI